MSCLELFIAVSDKKYTCAFTCLPINIRITNVACFIRRDIKIGKNLVD